MCGRDMGIRRERSELKINVPVMPDGPGLLVLQGFCPDNAFLQQNKPLDHISRMMRWETKR